MGVVLVLGSAALGRFELGQKWQAALAMTVVPFWVTADLLSDRLSRLSFWLTFGAFLLGHVLIIWVTFLFFLSGTTRFPFALSIPVIMVEGLFLLIWVDGTERRLHKRFRNVETAVGTKSSRERSRGAPTS